MFETYQPSGRFGIGLIFWLLAGIVAMAVLALVYQQGLHWIPLIYISVLLTVGFGMAVAFVANFIVDKSHCRNPLLAGAIALMLIVFGLGAKFYLQYWQLTQDVVAEQVDEIAPNLTADQKAEAKKQLRQLFRQEMSFFDHLKFRAEAGFNVGKAGRANNGAPISGAFVYLIWLIEAGIVAYFGIRPPMDAAGQPYSEKLGQWADEAEQVMLLPINNDEMVSQIKAATSVDDLLELPIPKTDQSHQFASYIVNSIPGQEMEDAYLSVDLLTLTTNKEGELETETNPLVKHAILTSEQRKQLVENSELLQEALAEYRNAVDEELAAGVHDTDDADGLVDGEEGEAVGL